ncbi:uncharacterized, partial [Tachysurus ichikawai]
VLSGNRVAESPRQKVTRLTRPEARSVRGAEITRFTNLPPNETDRNLLDKRH